MAVTAQSRIAAIAEKHADLGINVETFDLLADNPDANTKLTWMYRDGSNNKQLSETIFDGPISAQQLETIIAHLDEDGGFIPGQVGLDDLQCRMHGGYDEDLDHPFHDIIGIELTTELPNDRGLDEFVEEFANVSWDQEYVPE